MTPFADGTTSTNGHGLAAANGHGNGHGPTATMAPGQAPR